MIIIKEGGDTSYKISLEDDKYTVKEKIGDEWKPLFSNDDLSQKYDGVSSVNEDDELDIKKEVEKLKFYTEQKAIYIYEMCGDTRNYESRLDAVNENGKLVIYGEMFNHNCPELCEYYQLKISSDGYEFTVSDTSRFMERYLGEKKWMKMYGNNKLPEMLQEEPSDHNRQQFYQKLLNSAKTLLQQIRNRELVLFNARAWLDIEDLMHYYNVEAEFECSQPDDDDLPYEIIPKRESIMGYDGIPITIDDLYRAAELDIHSIDELCSIRKQYGSLEGFLKIDILDYQE